MRYQPVVFVSPSEPKDLWEIPSAIVNSHIESYGTDVLVARGGLWAGIQRKKVPEDLIASIQDGRLARELMLMREAPLDIRILLLEGTMAFDRDGLLVTGGISRRYTKTAIDKLLLSCQYVAGVNPHKTGSIGETVEFICDILVPWLGDPEHVSLFRRPGPSWDWGLPDVKGMEQWWAQGFPQIGLKRAEALLSAFTSPLAICNASVKELASVDGIGPKTARTIHKFLRREE